MNAISTLANLWSRRELLKHMVIANLKVARKDLLLGYFWWFLEPLLFTLLYWFLIEWVFNRGGPMYPLFLIAGLIPFRALIVSVAQSTNSIRRKRTLIGQIPFPKLLLPLADVIANHLKLGAGFIVIILFGFVYDIYPSAATLGYILLALCVQITIVTGLAFMMSIAGAYARDMSYVNQFILRAWLYITPVLYPLSRIPEPYQWVFWLNPMTPVIELYRLAFLGESAATGNAFFLGLLYGIALLVIGYRVFRHYEIAMMKRL